MTPAVCVYINVFSGLMYVTTLLGLDPFIRDPVAKFWQEQETPATKCILQVLTLARVELARDLAWGLGLRRRQPCEY